MKASSHNKRHSLTELREIYTIGAEWERPTSQLRNIITNRRNQSRKVEITILKRAITNGRNPEHRYSPVVI
jgi:hypothetical protein